jgi:hypothetical protein
VSDRPDETFCPEGEGDNDLRALKGRRQEARHQAKTPPGLGSSITRLVLWAILTDARMVNVEIRTVCIEISAHWAGLQTTHADLQTISTEIRTICSEIRTIRADLQTVRTASRDSVPSSG